MKRVEARETSWPCWGVLSCASVCKSWRSIVTEVLLNGPEQSGRLIFPISTNQVMFSPCQFIQGHLSVFSQSCKSIFPWFTLPGLDSVSWVLGIARRSATSGGIEKTSTYLLYRGSLPCKCCSSPMSSSSFCVYLLAFIPTGRVHRLSLYDRKTLLHKNCAAGRWIPTLAVLR